MEYRDCLAKACNNDDPVLRHIYVTMFVMSQYISTKSRLSKPFNPLLGETFEHMEPDCKYFAEQVSHHPPISASYTQSTDGNYEFWMNTYVKTGFWGTSIEIIPKGHSHVRLNNHKEMYSITRPSTTVHNLIMGEMYLDHLGQMKVTQISEEGV